MSIKQFIILAKLGQGAYSSVYKVQRKVDQQIYALKKVKMSNLSEKEQQNALNQVRILASIKSEQVIGYKHAFIQANSLCIIMEFADDGDLFQKIVAHQRQKTVFNQQTIWKALIQIAKGLKQLHELNILHRDLKSANVFLNKNGTAKLGDMNVSKIAKNGLLYTQTGTPYYASPQVWKDKPYDAKSDIWSLGCVIYQMATLKPPFRAQDMDGLYKKVTKGVYPKIGQNYSKNLSNVIKSMLQVNPSARPSAQQLYTSLKGKIQQLGMNLQDRISPNQQLLKTIRVQNKLHYLTDRMPKSNYQNGHQQEKPIKMTQSAKPRKQINKEVIKGIHVSKSINLPKLDRLIIKNGGIVGHRNPTLEPSRKNQRIEVSSALKIQGKSNKYLQQQQIQQKKVYRDIHAELRKIYNIKSHNNSKKVSKQYSNLPPIQ